MMISFLIAPVTTALVFAVWFEDLRQMETVPIVGTGERWRCWLDVALFSQVRRD